MPENKIVRVNGSATNVLLKRNSKPQPFMAEGELGVCDGCKCYCFMKQHERRNGVLFIKCISSDALVPVRTDINAPEECENFHKNSFVR